MEWKWTKGEPYERSRRIFKNEPTEIDETFSKEIETSAYSSALNYEQIGNNPFLGQNNYVNDIVVSNNFLKPINTTQDRTKEDNKSSNQVCNDK